MTGRLRITLLMACLPTTVAGENSFPAPVNSQAAGEHPPAPEEMPALFELPDGFHVTLYAGEPAVQQPIAFQFDDLGRIWVAENYTYSKTGGQNDRQRDRITILHDRDGDGRHDSRQVFWEDGRMLTGLAVGFGGVWVLNDGTLSLLPDRDEDDVVDGPPIEMLNGWTKTARHNFVNGLMWGPDGWLYGRHGITDSSRPGTPDTPVSERVVMNCGIWRFHPVRRQFEVVCNGTTNPWGLDYNRHGDLFMTNNVIGHLWHVFPGAHYKRMFGQDENPWLFELMEACSDHYHWDHSGQWHESRDGRADQLGGGHSHCGGMIYHGEQFPERYRGRIMMCNTHGRCVNVDRLERRGSSWAGRHEDNFLRVRSPWFRGVELRTGPLGSVYLSDWSDNGECHDRDGVHRASGRIYRISWGNPQGRTIPPPADLNDRDLVTNLVGTNSEWHRRRLFRVLTERLTDSGNKTLAAMVTDTLRSTLTKNSEKALLPGRALAFSGHLGLSEWKTLLQSSNEFLRAFAIRSFAEWSDQQESLLLPVLQQLSREESPVVLRECASALQRCSFEHPRAPGVLLSRLLNRSPRISAIIAADRPLTLLTWYGAEQEISAETAGVPQQLSRIPEIRALSLRRLAVDWNRNLDRIDHALRQQSQQIVDSDQKSLLYLLDAMYAGMQGQQNQQEPKAWEAFVNRCDTLQVVPITAAAGRITALFGGEASAKQLREIAANRSGDHAVRSRCIETLAALRDEVSLPVLLGLLNDRAVYVDVCRALSAFDDPRIPQQLLKHWKNLRHGSRDAAMSTLCGRRSYALVLARGLEDRQIAAADLSASQVRQLLSFNDDNIRTAIEKHWGRVNTTSEQKQSAIRHWQTRLSKKTLAAADLSAGKVLFRKTCANCHRLYGDGGEIGPDLTGSNRNRLDYLLENIIDPAAVVPRQFLMEVLALDDGRVVNGVVLSESIQTVVIQTDRNQIRVPAASIVERRKTSQSLMPNGLLDSLSENQIRDLIAFVMHSRGTRTAVSD